MLRVPAAIAALLLLSPSSAIAAPDLAEIARTAAGPARTATARVEAVVDWTHRNLKWTATDYRSRSVAEILERGGGNCLEQADVVRALLGEIGIPTRRIREVNIQPQSADRARGSRELMGRMGLRASVFGFQHNDHVWIEYFDKASGEWLPADPTLNLIGRKAWSRARLGFGPRPVHEIIPSRDMLVPIAIFVETGDPARPYLDRTRHYLIEAFAAEIAGARRNPRWSSWEAQIGFLHRRVMAAFEGRHDLHRDDEAIDRLRRTYEAMRAAA